MGIDYKKKYLKYKNKYLEAKKLYGGAAIASVLRKRREQNIEDFESKMADFESKFELFETNVEKLKREGKFDAAAAKSLKDWNEVKNARNKVHLKTLDGPHPLRKKYDNIFKEMKKMNI